MQTARPLGPAHVWRQGCHPGLKYFISEKPMDQELHGVFMAHQTAGRARTLYAVFYAPGWTVLNFRSSQVTWNKHVGDLSSFSMNHPKVPLLSNPFTEADHNTPERSIRFWGSLCFVVVGTSLRMSRKLWLSELILAQMTHYPFSSLRPNPKLPNFTFPSHQSAIPSNAVQRLPWFFWVVI